MAARTTAVSSTRRPSGGSYVLRRDRLNRERRRREPRRARRAALADEPRLEGVLWVLLVRLIGSNRLPMRRRGCPSGLIVDDHPLTRDALSSPLGQAGGFDVSEAHGQAPQRPELAHTLQPISCCSTLLDARPHDGSLRSRLRAAAPCEVVVLTRVWHRRTSRRAIRAVLRVTCSERAARADRGLPAAESRNGEAALSGEIARRLLDQLRTGGRLGGGVPTRSQTPLSGPRSRGAAAPRRPPGNRKTSPRGCSSRAHRALAREEPAAQTQRSLSRRRALKQPLPLARDPPRGMDPHRGR